MNRVTLIGNLTTTPEIRTTPGGQSVAKLRLAVSRPKRDGEDQGADYVDVTAFGTTAENCGRYLAKGRKVAIDGRLHHSEWDSDNGHRQKLEVIANNVEFLTPRGPAANPTGEQPHDAEPVAVGAQEDGEDIPF
jgi:single-strand DNA-binding protein